MSYLKHASYLALQRFGICRSEAKACLSVHEDALTTKYPRFMDEPDFGVKTLAYHSILKTGFELA